MFHHDLRKSPVTDPADWYAIFTRHQHEKSVARILSLKGFEIFLPVYTAVHLWKDRRMELSLPLFPCYLFFRGGLQGRWQILSTPGVHALVGPGGQPTPIPQTEIEAIRQVIQRRRQIEPHPYLKRGDWVRIKSGALEGIEGMLVRRKNLFRLVLSVNLLQKSVAVEVDATTLEYVRGCTVQAGTRDLESPGIGQALTKVPALAA